MPSRCRPCCLVSSSTALPRLIVDRASSSRRRPRSPVSSSTLVHSSSTLFPRCLLSLAFILFLSPSTLPVPSRCMLFSSCSRLTRAALVVVITVVFRASRIIHHCFSTFNPAIHAFESVSKQEPAVTMPLAGPKSTGKCAYQPEFVVRIEHIYWVHNRQTSCFLISSSYLTM